MILDIIASLAGMVLPPAVDFIKKKFLNKGEDTPEATLSALATTKPEMVEPYIKAQCDLLRAKKEYFNRDRAGEVSKWVDNLRASIRPLFVCASLLLKGVAMVYSFKLGSFRFLMESVIGSWFGCKLIPRK